MRRPEPRSRAPRGSRDGLTGSPFRSRHARSPREPLVSLRGVSPPARHPALRRGSTPPRRPRGADPRPAARPHDAREDRAAHAELPARAGRDHVRDAQPPHRERHRGGGPQVRRRGADRDGRSARLVRDRGILPRSAGTRLHRHRRGRAHDGGAGARAVGPHGRARRARSGAARPFDGPHRAHAGATAGGRSRRAGAARARPRAARALPGLRQPRQRGDLPRLPLRVHLLLGARLDRPQGALPRSRSSAWTRSRTSPGRASARSPSRTISSRSTASTSWRCAASSSDATRGSAGTPSRGSTRSRPRSSR